MNLVQRLRNLWKLSELSINHQNDKTLSFSEADKFELIKEKPHMATIIKKTTPVQDFLNEKQ